MQERTRWFVLAGALLLAGVLAWRLTSGSYTTDIRKICDAERSSGVDAKTDIRKVEAWAKDHLETPEASAWFAEFVKKPMPERAKGMRDESQRAGIAKCDLATMYEALALEGEYRQDLAGLCSALDMGKVEAGDDAERLKLIQDWINAKARSTRTKAMGEQLAQAEAKQRPDIVREAATAVAIYQCELVATLLKPQAHPKRDEPLIEVASPQINGDLTVDKVVAAFVAKKDAMRKCYDEGLAKNPELGGRLMLKMSVAQNGKTTKATALGGTSLGDPSVVQCAVKVAGDITFPPLATPLVTMLLPLDFIPRASSRAQPMTDPHGH